VLEAVGLDGGETDEVAMVSVGEFREEAELGVMAVERAQAEALMPGPVEGEKGGVVLRGFRSFAEAEGPFRSGRFRRDGRGLCSDRTENLPVDRAHLRRSEE
jgi:hypothetical protein